MAERRYIAVMENGSEFEFWSCHRKGSKSNYEDAEREGRIRLGRGFRANAISGIYLKGEK